MMTEVEPPSPPRPSFREGLLAFWSAMPDKTLFLVLAVAWGALFQFLGNSTLGYVKTNSLFGWLIYNYESSTDDQHGYLVPFVVAALFWWKREELMAVPKKNWWPGLIFLLLASLLHVTGYLVQQTRISVVAFFVGLYAITGAIWGWRWLMASFFPYCLFTFCLPLATVSDTLTHPLRMQATVITAKLAHILGINVIREGAFIYDPQRLYSYEVAAACSGMRSLIVTLALAVIFAFVQLKSPWRRAVMILSAVPLAVAANVFRLTTIIVAAEAFGQKAGDWVHSNSMMSLLPYLPAFIGLVVLSRILREDRPRKASEQVVLSGAEQKL
jgi:exosortase